MIQLNSIKKYYVVFDFKTAVNIFSKYMTTELKHYSDQQCPIFSSIAKGDSVDFAFKHISDSDVHMVAIYRCTRLNTDMHVET